MEPADLIVLPQFIQAIRDAGYRGTAAAVAELVDNSFEADARTVAISIETGNEWVTISVMDDGSGMDADSLRVALQFGGSTRFNSRKGIGRYGMGLPNSSVSQARRMDVTTWRDGHAYTSYLDVDAIITGTMTNVPTPTATAVPRSASGTIVTWSRCDRLDTDNVAVLTSRLATGLGRIFRHHLWNGRSITINGQGVQPVDPLFVRGHDPGAEAFGPPMRFEMRGAPGTIRVTFALLPIAKWEGLSTADKRSMGISKSPGISIVRGGREIDAGWYFMGKKRKENYDDWWRAEIEFPPTLDEIFGVTHTKQGIHPTQELLDTLTPDMEAAAHQLNAIVRATFLTCRTTASQSAAVAQRRDFTMEPPRPVALTTRRAPAAGGRTYRIEERTLEDLTFYQPEISADEILVILNRQHPFFDRVYEPVQGCENEQTRTVKRHLDLLLFAAARAEASVRNNAEKQTARRLRQSWSNALAAFLA